MGVLLEKSWARAAGIPLAADRSIPRPAAVGESGPSRDGTWQVRRSC
ncbi:hypothetical protein [Streptomyces gilvosporeus]